MVWLLVYPFGVIFLLRYVFMMMNYDGWENGKIVGA